MATTRDENFDLESDEFVPVGHIRKIDLDFVRSFSFWKTRIDQVMLNFFATTEKKKIFNQKIRIIIVGKLIRHCAKVKLLVAILLNSSI